MGVGSYLPLSYLRRNVREVEQNKIPWAEGLNAKYLNTANLHVVKSIASILKDLCRLQRNGWHTW